MLPRQIFLPFYSLKSPLLWVSESFRSDIGKNRSPWMKPCNLESFLLIKNISIMKNLTDFRQTVVTGVHPRLTDISSHVKENKYLLTVLSSTLIRNNLCFRNKVNSHYLANQIANPDLLVDLKL